MIQKFNTRAKKIDSLLCVGLDSDMAKLPKKFLDLPFRQFEFNKWIIESTHEYATAYKPNSAFYEARGEKGIVELKKTFDYLKQTYPDIYTILDAKRADIGNTNNGYVTYAFDWLQADAITLHPYLGFEAVEPFLARKDKDSIVLVKTSNPGAGEFQDITTSSGNLLWQDIAQFIAEKWNGNGNVLAVVGATYPDDLKKAREILRDMTILVPGVGAQGGSAAEVVRAGLAKDGLGLIINSSRGIIFAENPREEARKLHEEIKNSRKF